MTVLNNKVSLTNDSNKTKYCYFPEITMFLLFLGVSVLIFMKAYFGGEYTSPDSKYYLRAAQSILNGYGFNVYAEAGWDNSYFSHWPIGYPFLIACVSFITGTEVYLASKILTILTLAGIFGLLYLKFKKRAWVYSLVMVCYPSFLKDFYFTWSEQLFLFGSLLLIFQIIDIIQKDKPKIYHYFNVLFACLLMFLVRYAGIQTIGIIGLVITYFIIFQIVTKKSMLAKIIPLTVVGFVVFVVCLGYLYFNYVNTGYFGGDSRGEVHNFGYIVKSAIHLCLGQMREVFYIFQIYHSHLILLAMIILVFIFCQYRKGYKAIQSLDSLVFIAMSLFYILAFLFFRSTTEVDQHYERHLLVSTILFAFWCINIFFESENGTVVKIRQFAQRRKILSVCVLFIWFGITPLKDFGLCLLGFLNDTNVSYEQTRSKILNELSSVPPKASVIFDLFSKESFVIFLRPDINPMSLQSIQSLDIYENVYLFLGTEYIIPDYLEQRMQENSLLRDYISFRNNRLIMIK